MSPVTEELHEVSYIDQIRLFAIDHPQSEEIFTNDKSNRRRSGISAYRSETSHLPHRGA